MKKWWGSEPSLRQIYFHLSFQSDCYALFPHHFFISFYLGAEPSFFTISWYKHRRRLEHPNVKKTRFNLQICFKELSQSTLGAGQIYLSKVSPIPQCLYPARWFNSLDLVYLSNPQSTQSSESCEKRRELSNNSHRSRGIR